MIFKQLEVNYTSGEVKIIPCLLSTCAQSIILRFHTNVFMLNIIESDINDFTKSITEELTIKFNQEIIRITVLKQLLDIFPNVKRLNLYGLTSEIEGSWPSTHYTNLCSFNDNSYYSVKESKMIPLSLNGYQELECKPELMLRGIFDAKF